MTTHDVIIATLGRAHGLRGEVALVLRTDRPEARLEPGTAFEVSTEQGPRVLTLRSTRIQQGRWYAAFVEVTDRTAAEALRGIDLELSVAEEDEVEEDPEAWYPSQLKGLALRHVDGRDLGTVQGVDHYPAQDLLVVRTPQGRRVQLPLVQALIPTVDLEAGVIHADPPGGLFEDAPDSPQEG